ncbi:carboxylesterase [Aspergillus neoniger CBS 115656]|uniref:Carboxylesterase n=1 Tax=Aspergillus neoniger (strain CBS 115656) TaxID=1448310 RepID=A0A318YBD8_ASPNB|nr:carboxylesterase [Aspergillus neoniger CBS 115656]PYH31665.1 carboxylesterase [Aspergillus neoniger CBS 115656]
MLPKLATLVLAPALANGVAVAAEPLYKRPVNIPGYGYVQGKAAVNSSVSEYISNWENISFFGGIPFGADTSGANRWRDPRPAEPWNGTFNATEFGAICPITLSILADYAQSEDCLNLNIWTPATSPDEKLPVAIWSYGAGTAPPQTTYNGAGVADKGIIFVSYNYPNGVFGFMAHPELTETNGRNASGNWGVLDQYAAVKWVHENIAAFGGDPDHISVIGQSFGDAATNHIVNSELTADLGIVNAISESGVRSPNDPNSGVFECAYTTLDDAETIGEEIISSLNVSSIAEARAIDTTTLLDSTSTYSLEVKPVLDYYAIPSEYINTLEKGAGNKVPYITGNNANEDGASATVSTTVAAYKSSLNSSYGDFAPRFWALYPADNDTQAGEQEDQIVRDMFRVSSWQYMNGFSNSADQVDIYTYYWNYGSAAHASEIVYVLNNLWAQGEDYSEEDYYVANVMSGYWANFMKTGNPNTGGSYNNGTLPAKWNANSPSKNETFLVGAVYETMDTAATERVQLILDYFAAQTPY